MSASKILVDVGPYERALRNFCKDHNEESPKYTVKKTTMGYIATVNFQRDTAETITAQETREKAREEAACNALSKIGAAARRAAQEGKIDIILFISLGRESMRS